MMKILILIFLHLYYINCINIPKALRCVDISCKETISTGRILKATNPISGDLKILKTSSIVQVKGKDVPSANTLWLIEFDGFRGFVDMSLIKENTNNIRDDLQVYPNPYYTDKDEDDFTTSAGLFSNEKVNQEFENDDTEDFSELNEKQSSVIKTENNILLNNQIQNSETPAKPRENDENKLLIDLGTREIIEKKPEENSLVNNESIQTSEVHNYTVLTELKVNNEPVQTSEIHNSTVLTELKVNNESIKQEFQEHINNENVTSKMANEASSKNIETVYKNSTNEKISFVDKSMQLIKETANSNKIEQIVSSKINQEVLKDSDNKEKLNIDSKETKNDLEVERQDFVKSTKDINTEKTEVDINSKTETMKVDSETNAEKKDLKIEDTYYTSDTNTKEVLDDIKGKQTQLPSVKDENSSVVTEVNKHSELDKSLEHSLKSVEINSGGKEFPNEQISREKIVPLKSNEPTNMIKEPMPLKSIDQISDRLPDKDQEMRSTKSDENDKTISEPTDKIGKPDDESTIDNVKTGQLMDIKENSSEDKAQMKPDIVFVNETVTDKKLEKSISHDQSHEANIKVPLVNDNSENIIKQSEEKINESNKVKEMNDVPVVHPDATPVQETLVQATQQDPWVGNNERPGSNSDQDLVKSIRSPVLKVVLKLELLSQLLIKSFTKRMGFDSYSRLSQFCNDWLQMPLESFIFIVTLFSTLFLFVYTPKLFKFNRDWKSEFSRQSQVMGELESKLQSMGEVRQKLTVQNHKFEKVIDDYKQQIIEIQEDAKKNMQTVTLEIAKIKKSHDSKIKLLKTDLENSIQQTNIFQKELSDKETAIDILEEEKRNMKIQTEEEKSQLEETINKIQEQLIQLRNKDEDLKNDLQEKINQNEQLTLNVADLHGNLMVKNEAYKNLEKSFEHLKIFEDLDYGEFMEKKEICLDLTNTKDRLEVANNDIVRLENELEQKSNRVVELEETMVTVERKRIEYEKQKADAVASKEAAEIKLKVLSDYFKSKEVEMAKSLGHKVIETNQSIDQVDFLKHAVETLENENKEMTSTIQKLKAEVKESISFASKCKHDANEQINVLFLKNSTLERNLILEKDENKKLRTKLSHYVGPTPPRQNVNTSFNHVKDRPPSRQSVNSDSSGLAPFPQLIPIACLPQSPMQNNQFSGRNSVNSKKSNNT